MAILKIVRKIIPVTLILFRCLSFAQTPSSTYTLFLTGDAGEPFIRDQPLGHVLRSHVTGAGANATVLYLGDNVYPKGLPEPGTRLRKQGEEVLRIQGSWIEGLAAQGIILPGNHDWDHWRRKGWDYIRNQQQWIDSLKITNFTFLPRDGCPGPVELPLNDHNTLIILDSQWLLHQFDKPGEESSCDCKTPSEVLTALADALQRNHNKRVIIAAHHPVITYGEHGGVFTWKDHLFPLTAASPRLYIPLPVVGSFYPLYRKFFGNIQDTAHPLYKELTGSIHRLLKKYPGTVFVSGHEHVLEYIVKDSVHYIVSGSGSKTEHVKKKGYAKFARSVQGFVKLSLSDHGEAIVQFIRADETLPAGKEIFRASMPALAPVAEPRTASRPDDAGKVVRVKASEQYKASPGKKKWLGENYRAVWEQEVEAPVFDIGSEKGGLKILQKGGGQQTLSLRLEDSTGHEYVIRSIEKYPEAAVPEVFRKTFAQDLVQDQISASHPYAALVVPPLAEAAGIYHTNPALVFIPDDPRLGEYRQTFAGTLALFEERPAGNWKEAAFFGNSKKIINTSKVLEKLQADHDNRVDEEFVLRSRLFDLVIGDWDRHDDQWRWATMESKKGDTFRPIPRDRDQAFFVNEGWLSRFWSRKWALPKFEGFDEAIDWPSGLSYNARYFDRSFLTELPRDKWIEVAKDLQKELTDDAIESSIRKWPAGIYDIRGEKIIHDLKARRERLVEDALAHYNFLAREVDVVGSDKREQFNAERLSDGSTRVRVFKISKEGEKGKKLYDRVFDKNETREIRLYGLEGDDEFTISGSARKAILLRVIGGEGMDRLSDSSRVRSIGKHTYFYDQRGQFEIGSDNGVKDKTSSSPSVNEYNRKSFQYNRLAPLLYGNYNPDDGIFIGGGFIGLTHGFRKQPFKNRHLFLASIAPLTQSYNFVYQGKFTDVIGKWGFQLDAGLKSPNFVNNFFGLGNETVFDKDIEDKPGISVEESIHYYRYRFEEVRLDPAFYRTLFDGATFKIGPSFQRVDVEPPRPGQDRFINEFAATVDYDLYSEKNNYMGGAWQLDIDKRAGKVITQRGILLTASGRTMAGLDNHASTFSSYEGSLSLYHSFRSDPRVVFAVRVGAGANTNDYEFYQAQVLDGRTELRGFRKTRFYGDKKFYSNFEVRVRLLNFRSYLFPAAFGITGFHDLGRVWYKDANGLDPSAPGGTSSLWHKGWGGGIWFTPFDLTVLALDVAHSKEGTLPYIRLGFLF